ncbi:MAG: PEP-CTERM sorting domain-containing protein [Pseudomonadales bacterium]
MKTFTKTFVAGLLLCAWGSAYAVPINGSISWTANEEAEATVLFDFDTNDVWFTPPEDNAAVTAVDGDFADYFAVGDTGDYQDFNYSNPGFVLWEATGSVLATLLAFTVTSITDVFEQTFIGGTQALTLAGAGVLSDGTSESAGFWVFTANKAGGSFSWSSSQIVAVSEPGTVGLLGLGLLALGLMRRRSTRS